MRCPFCHHKETSVVDSRSVRDGYVVRRRRLCESCEKRFTTYEETEILRPVVIKKDGRKELFDREKMERGIRRALEKRPDAEEKIAAVLESVEYALREREVREITSRELGKLILERLKPLDPVAYLRFASVHKGFAGPGSFRKELDTLS